MAERIPNPGSPDAVAAGCTCPIMDNGRGRGGYIDTEGRPLFWYDALCPLHSAQDDGDASRVLLSQAGT